jgi:BirA family biotin operon repressor/biotin-[acetyl-CoA-carboxylase] ligase
MDGADTPTRFDAERFLGLAAARDLSLGRPLRHLEHTPSTMDVALAAARDGAPAGTLVVAEAQTAGRGRHGRAWRSTPGRDLTFSVLLRPRLAPTAAPLVALACGLAVRAAVAARVAATPLVKWPNDVLVDGRKIAGVLVESRARGDALEALVVGVGVNVEARDFSPELRSTATSLALAGATDRGRERWLVDFLEGLARRLSALECGGVEGIVEELGAYDALRGRALSVGPCRGVGAGIDPSGALLVRSEAGATVAVTAGSVVLEPPTAPT